MRDDPDGWAQARDATREDVRAVFAPRERTCPGCGHVQSGSGRLCERCGADLTAPPPKPRPWGKIALGALVVLILAAASYPLFAALRDDAGEERTAADRRQVALEERERARLRRESRPVARTGPAAAPGADPLAHRAALVGWAERRITADARRRVADGELRGRFLGTACTPFPNTEGRRTAERAPTLTVGRYDCVAYTSKFELPEVSGKRRTGYFGNPYWLVVEYADSKLVWCKVTPRAGEGGRSLAVVPVPAPCRDPAGPG